MEPLTKTNSSRIAIALLLIFGFGSSILDAAAGVASPKPGAPAVDREAQEFVRELLAQRPAKEFSVQAVFHIRHPNGRRSRVPVNYSVRLDDHSWQSIYLTERTESLGPEQLIVTHQPDQPNRYQFVQISFDGSRTNTMNLTGSEAAVSFAGSDFWLTDLGLEFLHWPQQRQIRDAKITMRWGRPMKVVESTNPRPAEGTYSRVVSWIDAEFGSVVRAEAYDTQGKRFKFFDLKGFQKVHGRYEVKEMELRNDKADSRTRLEFHFETE